MEGVVAKVTTFYRYNHSYTSENHMAFANSLPIVYIKNWFNHSETDAKSKQIICEMKKDNKRTVDENVNGLIVY